MRTSLVIGADGQIGRALVDSLRSSGDIVLETTRRLDITSERRLFLDLKGNISNWHPPVPVSVAYLCAAVTSQEACQQDPTGTSQVNVYNTIVLARRLMADGTRVVFLSTNLVFDGTVPYRKMDAPVNPRTEYGRQKAEVERQFLRLGTGTTIVRLTKVLCPCMPLFAKWRETLKQGGIIHPFSNLVMAPIPLMFVVDILYLVGSQHLSGVLQISADQDITYTQAAEHLAKRLCVRRDLVQSVEVARSGLTLEHLPAHTTLDITRLRAEFGLEPPSIWTTVELASGL